MLLVTVASLLGPNSPLANRRVQWHGVPLIKWSQWLPRLWGAFSRNLGCFCWYLGDFWCGDSWMVLACKMGVFPWSRFSFGPSGTLPGSISHSERVFLIILLAKNPQLCKSLRVFFPLKNKGVNRLINFVATQVRENPRWHRLSEFFLHYQPLHWDAKVLQESLFPLPCHCPKNPLSHDARLFGNPTCDKAFARQKNIGTVMLYSIRRCHLGKQNELYSRVLGPGHWFFSSWLDELFHVF